MAQRANADMGLVDGLTSDLGGPRTAALLERLDAAVPWDALARPIEALPEYRAPARGEQNKGGRPACPARTMLRCVLLAKWLGLGDAQFKECLKDRLSFRRFAGLSLTDATPDETTFVVSRRRLREAGLDRRIFAETVAQLELLGLLVKDGTLVDATIVEQSKSGRREDGTSTRDQEASFEGKHGRSCHGYKGHIAADRSALVTCYRFSGVARYDSRFIDELALERRGVACAIAYKRQRGWRALEPVEEQFNRLVARLRAVVEQPFVWMKNAGFRRVRYRGLRRNELDFALHLVAYNWQRSLSLG